MALKEVIGLCSMLICCTVLINADDAVVRFGSDEINEIVKAHNDLRRSIYNAANMKELTWNEGVAMASAEWGSKCEYISRPDNQWGQNMNYFHGREKHKAAIALFTDSFHAWSNESMHYDYRKYRYCGSKNVCSYAQLIAADAQQMGCSIVKCPQLHLKEPEAVQNHAKLLVCFYTPWVDIVKSEVFIHGERCGMCPKGTVCVDNLCSSRFHKADVRPLPSIGSSEVKINIHSISGSRGSTSNSGSNVNSQRRHGSRGDRRNRLNRIIGSNNKYRTHASNSAYQEHRRNQESYAVKENQNDTVVYTPNNRVIPFPGKSETRDVRRIERYLHRHTKSKHAELVKKPELVVGSTSVTDGKSRKKRQTSHEDAVYQRRLEYRRYLRDRELRRREIIKRQKQYEDEMHRREQHRRNQMELRRINDENKRAAEQKRYDAAMLRRRQERDERRRRNHNRIAALALTQNEGELTGEEQFFTVSAHNLLRRESGAKDLSWNSHLERWAKYVIRCEIEYPGPISCYTNFGKAKPGQDIYNVVYQWGSEGNDLEKPLQYGCRTPYDKGLCNHNTIITNKSLTQMACAAKSCGSRRQLTCIYNSS